MLYVPVVSSTNKPLMPCHPARARELVRAGKAVRRFNKGLFYIKLIHRQDGDVQPIAVGIDPGSKREAFTVKSEARTLFHIQAKAVDWVKDAIKTRREMRRGRRFRKTPYRQNRMNRSCSPFPPSTKARWGWKLRIVTWLSKVYPISAFVVEDIKAVTKPHQKKWNMSFSPLEVGKKWFKSELEKIAPVHLKEGWETAKLRLQHGLEKSTAKLSEVFEAHCVDSWVLANSYVGGHIKPEYTRMLLMEPLRFHRRQLHKLLPEVGGIRKRYGGTLSNGFKRGSLVKHIKHGLVYVGGFQKERISLHSLTTGKRLGQSFRPEDCIFLAYNSWRTRLLPAQEIA